jgi:hypothetical protein
LRTLFGARLKLQTNLIEAPEEFFLQAPTDSGMNHQRLHRANSCIRECNAKTATKYKTMR